MRFFKTTLLLVLTLAWPVALLAQTNTWNQKNDVGFSAPNGPEGRTESVGFSIGTKGYIGTGYTGSYKNDFWEYDPNGNTWTQKANFGGTARRFAVGFSIGTKGYIGTGLDGGRKNDFWEYDPSDNTWTQKANFGGTARYEAVGFSIGTKGYIGTGNDIGGYKNDFWEYDPATDTWTQMTDFGGTARVGAVGFSVGGKGYIGTGSISSLSEGSQIDFWEYDPLGNTWTQKANFAGSARRWAVGFSIVTNGYVGTGSDSNGSIKKDLWEYNPAENSWTQKANCIGPARYYAVGFGIGTKGYVGTGAGLGNGLGFRSDFGEYDPTGNTWTRKAYLGGTARYLAVGFSIGTKGYIGTGFDGDLTNDFWEYDPTTSTWSQKADFGGTARFEAVGFSIGTKGYIGTGSDNISGVQNDFWEYDPLGNTWTQKASFGGAARRCAVGFCIGNKGYIGTGDIGIGGSGTYVSDFWEYDPLGNTWTQKASFGGAARRSAVGFCIGNKGYIGTGYDTGSSDGFRDDFWEYDPTSNIWALKANFNGARYGTVGFSIGTKGYIGTGSDNISGVQNDFWEYDPAADTWTQKTNFGGTARGHAVGFSIGTKGYVGTGLASGPKKDFWEYTPDVVLTCTVAGSSFCADGTANVTVTYTAETAANPGNTFTAQLSDATGFFPPVPTTLGSVGSTTSGTITCTIPLLTPVGSGYRIRVVASDPVAVGTNNGSDLSIAAPSMWYQDLNNDGVGDPLVGLLACTQPPGYVNDTINDSWFQRTDVGYTGQNQAIGRAGAVGFSIGTKGYIGTGTDGSLKRDFWEYDPGTNAWAQKADFGGTARQYAVGFSVGTKGYIGTGTDGGFRQDFWEYDPLSNAWTQKANAGGAVRIGASAFSIGSKGYIVAGYDGSYRNDFWEYDPASDAWTAKASFGGSARAGGVGFRIGGKGYYGTGNGGGGNSSDLWEYDPASDTWTQKANFGGGARTNAVAFGVGTKGYLGTGIDGAYKNDLWEYDPLADSWTQKPDCPGPARYLAVGFSIGPKGYMGTGSDGVLMHDFWEFQPYLPAPPNTWTQQNDLGFNAPNEPAGRAGAVGFSIGSKGYISTGSDGSLKNDLWEYDPATNAWAQKADFGGTARQYAVGFSIGTKGYVGTGNDGGFRQDFWEYDPLSNTWTQKANVGGVVRAGAAAFSIGTKGYIVGGFDGTYQNDCWEYDPTSDTWTARANFGGTARAGAVGFTVGTKGYCGTGNGTAGSFSDLWEYDPAADTWTSKADFGGGARTNAVAFAIGALGYICTGYDNTYRNDLWAYHPATNTWAQKANYGGSARYLAVGFSIGSNGYVGTGNDGVLKRDFWSYHPDLLAASGALAFCQGSSVVLSASYGSSFFWSTGATTPSITVLSSGTYMLLADGIILESVSVVVTPALTWYADVDGDGSGDAAVDSLACTQPIGYVASNTDNCPTDPNKTVPGICGCGTPDTDSDSDAIADCNDSCPALSGGTGDVCDDGNANTTNDVITVACVCAGTPVVVTVSVRVFLDGPYNSGTGLMNDVLRSLGTFPLTDPYPGLGYVHTGSGNGGSIAPAVLAVSGNDAIVDWVVLELRSPAAPASIIASRSALVQRDGDVVELDGASPVSFSVVANSYQVAVLHRNHLGCMAASPVALSSTTTAMDFSTNNTTTYGTFARKSVPGSFPAEVLWAGDVTFNSTLQYIGLGNDRDPILVTVGSTTPNNVLSNAYSTRDVNMDGNVQYIGSGNDRDPILVNVGSTTPNNVRVAQLP